MEKVPFGFSFVPPLAVLVMFIVLFLCIPNSCFTLMLKVGFFSYLAWKADYAKSIISSGKVVCKEVKGLFVSSFL